MLEFMYSLYNKQNTNDNTETHKDNNKPIENNLQTYVPFEKKYFNKSSVIIVYQYWFNKLKLGSHTIYFTP